jgi:hypothetical protein
MITRRVLFLFSQQAKQTLKSKNMQDKSKPGWNRVQKYMFYAVLGLTTLKMYTYLYKFNILYSFNPTN